MKEPKKFPGVLSGVMLVVAILFGGAGAVGYMAYGSDIQTVVLVNLPQEDKFVQAVQFLCTLCRLDHSSEHTLTARFDRNPALYPTTAFPSRQDHGEWSIRPIWQEQLEGQMAKEPLPSRNSHLLLSPLLG